ncbi:hypothetical protein LTR37_011112 [Vermiconidia calcicola]|uniref:Uncharacterized protein n=1 Tax=Vermiconidia calcicola TaxID=1690605 RepID=A0ACC3N387_9PEZI|nr:hypothetical protein LTR37_011112 [Vermiconidia calcicola]
MSDHTNQPTRTERFMRGAGEVREDPEHRMWAPARWVAQMVQYLVAIIIVTIGEGFKAIWTGESPARKRRHETQHKKH